MELFQVRYFLALAKTLNFMRAAETCNVSQPALTRAIQKLEEELGGPLIYRERSLTQLTERGLRCPIRSFQVRQRRPRRSRQPLSSGGSFLPSGSALA